MSQPDPNKVQSKQRGRSFMIEIMFFLFCYALLICLFIHFFIQILVADNSNTAGVALSVLALISDNIIKEGGCPFGYRTKSCNSQCKKNAILRTLIQMDNNKFHIAKATPPAEPNRTGHFSALACSVYHKLRRFISR